MSTPLSTGEGWLGGSEAPLLYPANLTTRPPSSNRMWSGAPSSLLDVQQDESSFLQFGADGSFGDYLNNPMHDFSSNLLHTDPQNLYSDAALASTGELHGPTWIAENNVSDQNPRPPIAATATAQVRIPRKEWDIRKLEIQDLYLNQGRTLSEIRKTMEQTGFFASERKFKDKLKEWGFKKNMTGVETSFIRKKAKRRQQVESKETEFSYQGKRIPDQKVQRYLQTSPDDGISATGSTPSQISYRTKGKSRRNAAAISPLPTSQQKQFHGMSDIQPRPNINSHPGYAQSPRDTISLDWHGMKMNDLIRSKSQAMELFARGDIADALPLLHECLDGLEELMGPGHVTTVSTLDAFLPIALANELYSEVEQRLLKSMAAHEISYGVQDKRTLQSYVRIGKFYFARDQLGEAEKLLTRAKIGFEALHSGDPEKLFIETKPISMTLINISSTLNDFDKAESEYSTLISNADALGTRYAEAVRELKHNLCHFYSDNLATGKVPFAKLEEHLLHLASVAKAQANTSLQYMCVWNQLRQFYQINGDEESLDKVIHDTENFLSSVRIMKESDKHAFYRFKMLFVLSLIQMHKYAEAEWWAIELQTALNADQEYGAKSRMALDIQILHAKIYLAQDKWEDAEKLFLEAQRIAKGALDVDDPLHRRLEHCLETRTYQSSCPTCEIN